MKQWMLSFLFFASNVFSLTQPFSSLSLNPTQKDMYGFYVSQVFILYSQDAMILKTVQENTLLDSKKFWQKMSSIGNGKYLLPGTYALSLLLNQGKNYCSFLTGEVMQSFLLSGLITQVLKYSIGRSRPYKNNGPYHFVGPSIFTSTHSFPSGHCQAVFSIATVLSDKYHLGYVFYPIASLVAISRVYNNKHWASDILMGSLIGIFSAKIVDHKKIRTNQFFRFWVAYNKIYAEYTCFFDFPLLEKIKKFDFSI